MCPHAWGWWIGRGRGQSRRCQGSGRGWQSRGTAMGVGQGGPASGTSPDLGGSLPARLLQEPAIYLPGAWLTSSCRRLLNFDATIHSSATPQPLLP